MFGELPSDQATPSAPVPSTGSFETPGAPAASYEWDLASDELTWSADVSALLQGADPVALAKGRSYAGLLASDSPSSRYEAIMRPGVRDTGDGVPYTAIYGLVFDREARRAATVWVVDQGRWFAGPNGRPIRAQGRVSIVTEHYEAERQRTLRSQLDQLTQALNRSVFIDVVARKLALEERRPRSFSLLLVGIENLGWSNLAHGFGVGDELIHSVAERLRGCMRGGDIMARYAGNIFALLLETCDLDQMQMAAARFLASVDGQEIESSAGRLPIRLRVGGVVAPRHGRTVQRLLQHAEEALEAARAPGAEPFIPYEPSLARDDAKLQARFMAEEISAALDENRIFLAVQPVIAAATGVPAFYEGLMRLQARDGRFLAPIAVFPVAEETGLVRRIDERMLDLALTRLAAEPGLHLAINCSSRTIHHPKWADRLQTLALAHPGCIGRLIIELTESCAIEDVEATRLAILATKACGAKVAMDDFGAGHTSFRNLRGLGFDLLKIDGAFVQNLKSSPDDSFFVRKLVELAQHLDIPIVAEWVEDQETAGMLVNWGVTYLQGHLFGRAECAEQDAPLLSRAVA
jgi:diguanylate cyclase (GGDEF)-like protein